MKSKIKYLWSVLALMAVVAVFPSCSKKKPIDNVSGKVVKVINGNTIKLDNGLTVHLLGVPANTQTENYLKTTVLHNTVTLTSDKKSAKPKAYKKSSDQVWAYVKVKEGNKVIPVNGTMIRNKICAVNVNFVGDSLQKFKEVTPLPDKMAWEALKAKMVPASFMIRARDYENSWLGTGFFISENGLALTNEHVLGNKVVDGYVSLPNADGRIDGTRNRGIVKLLYVDPDLDYTIFQVQLDPGEKVPCLEVANMQAVVPDEVGVVGNPLGLDALFTQGTVSQIFNEAGKIAVTADITSGNSGGPICNRRGQVVGISQSVARTEAGEAPKFGVDIMRVRQVLDNHSDIPTYAGK